MWLIAAIGVVVGLIGVWLHRSGHPWVCVILSVASPIVLFIILLNVTSP
jgi:hypothetical protein